MTTLQRFQAWYTGQCNEDWEHTYGIEIQTLDNPGWRIIIQLMETPIEKKTFKDVRIQRASNDWIDAWVKDNTFNLACGPKNLEEALKVFCDWTES